MEPLINIITRTSNRPNSFKRNVESVKSQTYKNYRHIVCYDTIEDYESYLKEYDDIDLFYVNKDELLESYDGIKFDNPNFWLSAHNLYCNVGLDKVEDGWVIFLDDDDHLIDEFSLEKMSKLIGDEDTLLIWQMEYGSGQRIPSSETFKNSTPIISLGNIGSECFIFHSKWCKSCRWDSYKCSDFRFIECLSKQIPTIHWLEEALVKVPFAGFGLRKDVI
jgi:glycosyltransferase involved in cell wall biosynthesis